MNDIPHITGIDMGKGHTITCPVCGAEVKSITIKNEIVSHRPEPGDDDFDVHDGTTRVKTGGQTITHGDVVHKIKAEDQRGDNDL
jgi:hypothetical protein